MLNNVLWFVFIKPYTIENGEWLPSNAQARVQSFCPPCAGQPCPTYVNLQGGEFWGQYKDPRNGTNSYELARELAEEIMSEYGYKVDHIRIVSEMNKDALMRPTF